jgi:RNA polymerase sigma factor (sigma-70 family)
MRAANLPLESLAARACEGDANALESLITAVQGDVYNLAVRMLWHPVDAEDATQEILLKVATRLATFRHESSFRTWMFRVATNHLLNTRRSSVERQEITFADFAADLATDPTDVVAPPSAEADQALLELEVKVGCTQGMLLCLDRDDRIAYVLGDIFELKSEDAADILGIAAPAFRKRLSRAREALREFMMTHCGLANTKAACRCSTRVPVAIARGRVDPGDLHFASPDRGRRRALPVQDQVAEIDELHRIAGIFRSHPDYTTPDRIQSRVREILRSHQFSVLT